MLTSRQSSQKIPFLGFLSLALLAALSITAFGPAAEPLKAAGFGDISFERLWQQADGPVAAGKAKRSWLWGATSNWAGYENYEQAKVNSSRLVQYFDKSRMEINDITQDRNSPTFVSNGLLTIELVSGKMQVGDTRFENRSPASIPVAGDYINNGGPTYASLAGLTTTQGNFAGDRTGQLLDERVNVGGQVSQIEPPVKTNYAYYEGQTRHNIPAVLWNWMQNIAGSDWVYALGYPISEAYWSRFNVGGQNRLVLVQLFQRRVLTYTPTNPAEWQVEMGNIGLHYFNWRYNGSVPAPILVTARPAATPVAARPAATQVAVKPPMPLVTAAPSNSNSNPLDGEEQAFVKLVNDYRRANGLGELAFQPTLQAAAAWMSKDMADKNYFSHTDSLGRDPFKRLDDFDYKGGWMGENLAAGRASGDEALTQFKNSPVHNSLLLKGEFTKVGVHRYFWSGSTYGWYWTVDFGDN